jgi:hypothetical protein
VVLANAVGQVTSAVAVSVTGPCLQPPTIPPGTPTYSHLTRPRSAPTNSFLAVAAPWERLKSKSSSPESGGAVSGRLRLPAGLGGGEGGSKDPPGTAHGTAAGAFLSSGRTQAGPGQVFEPAVVAWNDGAITPAWRRVMYRPRKSRASC